MPPLNINNDLRMAGQVKRYHVHPVTAQSVAEHSWQICRILMSITTEDIAAILLPHAILHDVGEVACGDIPYPVKQDNPDLDRMFSEIESRSVFDLQKKWNIPSAVIYEWDGSLRWIFKTAEFIEMMEFGMEEVIRGNQFGRIIYERCWDVVQKRLLQFEPSEDFELETMTKIRAYIALRMEMWKPYV